MTQENCPVCKALDGALKKSDRCCLIKWGSSLAVVMKEHNDRPSGDVVAEALNLADPDQNSRRYIYTDLDSVAGHWGLSLVPSSNLGRFAARSLTS